MPASQPTTIRQVQPADVPALLELYQHLHPGDLPPAPATLASRLQEFMQHPGLHCLVAVVDGQLAASCTLVLIPNLTRGARPYGLIENVITHPAYRRQGLGTRVLQHALAIAWKHACYKVMLLTGTRQEAVLRFYEQAGFQRGVKTGFIAHPPDQLN